MIAKLVSYASGKLGYFFLSNPISVSSKDEPRRAVLRREPG